MAVTLNFFQPYSDDITPREQKVLDIMPDDWTLSKDIAEEHGLKPDSIRTSLQRLEARGLVERKETGDKRTYYWRKIV